MAANQSGVNALANTQSYQNLYDAVSTGKVEVARELLNSNPELINARYSHCIQPYHPAVYAKECTPLYIASSLENLEMVNMLLGFHPDVTLADGTGLTPLHQAAMKGHTEIVAALLNANADPKQVELRNGITPLHLAASRGDTKTINILIEGRADVTQIDNNGNPPLYNALKTRNIEAAKTLIAAGADLNALSEEFKATLTGKTRELLEDHARVATTWQVWESFTENNPHGFFSNYLQQLTEQSMEEIADLVINTNSKRNGS